MTSGTCKIIVNYNYDKKYIRDLFDKDEKGKFVRKSVCVFGKKSMSDLRNWLGINQAVDMTWKKQCPKCGNIFDAREYSKK